MAEATQEGQVHQSEQLDALKNQMGKDLTAVIQQLMISNSTETSTKEHSITIHFKLFKFHTFISFAIL